MNKQPDSAQREVRMKQASPPRFDRLPQDRDDEDKTSAVAACLECVPTAGALADVFFSGVRRGSLLRSRLAPVRLKRLRGEY